MIDKILITSVAFLLWRATAYFWHMSAKLDAYGTSPAEARAELAEKCRRYGVGE